MRSKPWAPKKSLDLAQHPATVRRAGYLARCWERSGQADKAARLGAGDISDLLPVIAEIEAEHRAWVAEDPEHRSFGPPPPDPYKAPKLPPQSEDEKATAKLLQALTKAAIDLDDLERRLRSGEMSEDDFATLVAETLAGTGK